MNELLAALRQAGQDAFTAAAKAENFAAGWTILIESGFPDMLLHGNPGWPGMVEMGILAGGCALPFPVGEAAIAHGVLERLRFTEPGFAAIGCAQGTLGGSSFTGVVRDVPWGRHADFLTVECDGKIFVLAASGGALSLGTNLAHEPRDIFRFNHAPVLAGPAPGDILTQAALLIAAQTAGVLQTLLALSIEHANTRQQFGRPLGKFQAVQQNLAILATETAACLAACRAAGASNSPQFARAAAKLRACIAADAGGAIAHQIHGAIGFTQEFALHHYTRRLSAWRDEFGNDRFWAERLGAMACGWGAEGLWPALTAMAEAGG